MSFNKKKINAIFNDPKEKKAIDEWLHNPHRSVGTSKAKKVMELAKKRNNSIHNPEVVIVSSKRIPSKNVGLKVRVNSREEESMIIVRGKAATIAKRKARLRRDGK